MHKEMRIPGQLKAARLYHETAGRLVSGIRSKSIASRLSKLEAGEYINRRPEFISQLARADRSKISGFYGKIADPEAALRFGASNEEELSYWSWRSCGIVGIQMAIKALGDGFDGSTMDLVNEGLGLNGYDRKNDVGWYHNALAALAGRHGLEARVKKHSPSNYIAEQILNDSYVLASMKSETGGHLLLVYGAKLAPHGKVDGFWLHDPNDYEREGEAQYVKKGDFDKLYTRRVIVLKRKND